MIVDKKQKKTISCLVFSSFLCVKIFLGPSLVVDFSVSAAVFYAIMHASMLMKFCNFFADFVFVFSRKQKKKNLRRWFFSRQFFDDSITNWCWFSSFWSLCRGLDTAANNNNNDWPSLVMFPHIFTSKFSFSLDLSVWLLWGRKRFSSLQHTWKMVLDSLRGGNPGDLSPFPTFLASELIELVYFVIQTKITTMYNPWVEKFFLVCYPPLSSQKALHEREPSHVT